MEDGPPAGMVADPPWPRVVSCSERHFSLFLLFSQRIISERGRDPRGNPRFPAARRTE